MQQNFTHCYARRSLMALLWLLLPCIYLHAQKSAQPGRNVTITNSHISLRDVFNVIEKQTGVVLFFGDLNISQLVGVKFVATPVEEALAEMLPPLGLTYEYVKGNRDKIFIRSIVGERKKDTVMVISVSGVVTDDKGAPLPGATVRVKGTRLGTATKANGMFTLSRAGADDVIQVSYTGFIMAEVALDGRASVRVQLKPGDNNLDETVVTAYGTSTQRALTGAISIVKGEEIQTLPNRSFDKSLQGLVPGLLVTSGTGQPGGGVSNFVLRGIATAGDFQNGSTVRNPLIIIDGIPISQDQNQIYIDGTKTPINNPLAQINTSDVETINVLKDASAIALYGSRASNGVIVITTKKGRIGKPVFSFRTQVDIATRSQGKVKPLNERQYLELLYETYRNSNPASWTDAAIKADLLTKFPYLINAAGDSSFYPEQDWNKELFSSHALTTSNELSMSGGNEKSNYYLNLEYTKQNGVVRKTGYDRKSVRFNFESYPEKWLKVGINTSLSYNVQDYQGALNGSAGGPLSMMMSPLNPVRLQDGTLIMNYKWGNVYSSPMFANPVAEMQYNLYNNTSYRGISRVYGEVSLLKYFKWNSSLGVDYTMTEAKEKIDPRLYDISLNGMGGRIEERDARNANIITTNILRFERTFNADHVISVLLGQEAQIRTQKVLAVAVTGLAFPFYDQINSPGVVPLRQSGYTNKETLQSFFGQANYGFKNKYFLSASTRTDGSSRFGDDRRYGLYWSAGAGWLASSEHFMKKALPVISYLKLRGSIGAAGNAGAINAVTRFDALQAGKYNGGTAVFPITTPGNQDVRWEQTFTWDAGLDAKLLNDRFSVAADFYERNTSDLLYTIQLPQSSGYYQVLANIGKMRNRGVEFAFAVDIIKRRDFTWSIAGNWATNKNLLVKANTNTESFSTAELYNKEGENFNSFYLRKWAGVNPENGMPQWIDSTGKPTEDYNAAKREFVGKPQPDGFGSVTNSFSYKGVELSVNFYYQYGYQIYNADRMVGDGYIPYMNQDVRALDRWRRKGDIASNPLRKLNNSAGRRASSRYLYSGDHIRLQNATIAYSFPKTVTERLHINMLRVFVQGYNLALWSRYPGQDPNNVNSGGTTGYAYPMQRSYSAGLNVNF